MKKGFREFVSGHWKAGILVVVAGIFGWVLATVNYNADAIIEMPMGTWGEWVGALVALLAGVATISALLLALRTYRQEQESRHSSIARLVWTSNRVNSAEKTKLYRSIFRSLQAAKWTGDHLSFWWRENGFELQAFFEAPGIFAGIYEVDALEHVTTIEDVYRHLSVYEVTANNNADEPISDVVVRITVGATEALPSTSFVLPFRELTPKETKTRYYALLLKIEPGHITTDISFTDSAGTHWYRSDNLTPCALPPLESRQSPDEEYEHNRKIVYRSAAMIDVQPSKFNGWLPAMEDI